MQKRNKSKTLYTKEIILKGNITSTYIEHKLHKNTGTSVLIHPRNIQIFKNSIIKTFWIVC